VGASGDGQEHNLLRVKSNEKCQRGRRREGKEIGERRRRGVHWQGRNRPEMPAGGRSSDEQLRRSCCVSCEEEKRDEGGGVGAFYRRVLMAIKRAV
jgi:hypothetical protein